VLKNGIRHPKIIVTGNGLDRSDDNIRVVAAHNEQKCKIISMQYGGSLGSSLFISTEEHDIAISNIYLTWGWRKENCNNVLPFYFTDSRKVKPHPSGYLLMIGCSIPRFSCWLQSVPLSSTILELLNEHIIFLKHLDNYAFSQIEYRLYHDYGWNEYDRLNETFSNLKFQDMKSFEYYSALKQTKLAIVTYNATTLLENMTINFPTIAFWNPNHWELRDEAIPVYNQLINCGILYHSPEACAKKVNEIYMDPFAWWFSENVQTARKMFCEHYSRESDNIVNDFRNIIKRLL
jgi:putative transferase (TIGR04331 family)